MSKKNITAWERVEIARSPKRKTAIEYVEKIFDEFIELHGDRSYKDDKVIIVDITGKVNSGHGGLIANKLAHQYMRPVILVNDKGGSARGYDKHPIDNFKEWVEESEIITGSGK